MKICTLFSVFIFLSFWGFAQQQGLETVLQKGHSKLLSSYCFSPDGQYVVTGAQDIHSSFGISKAEKSSVKLPATQKPFAPLYLVPTENSSSLLQPIIPQEFLMSLAGNKLQ
jgi:WD40 repeat protein